MIIFTIAFGKAYGQFDSTTIYKNLETKKFYSVSLSSQITKSKSIYKVNGKKVSKSTYNKYKSTWINMKTCCPCILKSYDENDVLISEAVSCTDCKVGWFKSYWANGNLKLTAYYKENPTGNWNDIWKRGYCSVRNGKWTYYDVNGNTLYSEFWENGVFVKQEPEQNEVEIWKVEIKLFGQDASTLSIPIDKVGDLAIEPKYKNSKTASKVIIKFEVSAIGFGINEKEFTLESFKEIDVKAMLLEVGIPNDKTATFILSVYSDEKLVKRFFLNLIR